MESILVKIPSMEKKLKDEDVWEHKIPNSEDSDISLWKIWFPSSQINSVISYVKETMPEQIDKEKFIKIPIIIARMKNWYGDSTSWPL